MSSGRTCRRRRRIDRIEIRMVKEYQWRERRKEMAFDEIMSCLAKMRIE